MIEFGEVLTLAIGIVASIFIIVEWRRIWPDPSLRQFLGPLACLMCVWVTTILEDLFLPAPQPYLLSFAHSTPEYANAPLPTQVFDFLEHASYAAFAVWMFVVVLRTFIRHRKAPA